MGNNAALYALTDEHEAIREAVRDIAEREIAPFAAEVDAESRYPIEAQKALTAAGFHATHIPEAYGGEGADAIATCIVIEEVARVDVSAFCASIGKRESASTSAANGAISRSAMSRTASRIASCSSVRA